MAIAAPLLRVHEKCPRCSFPLVPDRLICSHCGNFVGVNTASMGSSVVKEFMPLFNEYASIFTVYNVVVALACVPLILAPPVAALAIILLNVSQNRSVNWSNWRAPIVIAVVNIVVSIFMWQMIFMHVSTYLHDILTESRSYFWEATPAVPIKAVPL